MIAPLNGEIEFLPVGSASKAGDAVVIRYGQPYDYRLMLVDGGHAETGDEIVAHLRRHFGPHPVLEHVVLTHSDGGYASGLRTVMREIRVANLWLHAPWLHAAEALHLFANKSMTVDGLTRRIKGEYDVVSEICDLALAQGSTVHGAFQGEEICPFRLLSPSRQTYVHLLPQFERTPGPDGAAIEAADLWIGKASAIDRLIQTAPTALQSWTTESWYHERLRDGGITSASNETSVVLYGSFAHGPALLTGNAGIRGLTWAADAANRMGLPLQTFNVVQIPHHGSRRNSGPTILDHLLGGIQPEPPPGRDTSPTSPPPPTTGSTPARSCSTPSGAAGGTIIATQGTSKVH